MNRYSNISCRYMYKEWNNIYADGMMILQVMQCIYIIKGGKSIGLTTIGCGHLMTPVSRCSTKHNLLIACKIMGRKPLPSQLFPRARDLILKVTAAFP